MEERPPDPNSLAYWLPPLERAGLPTPRTEIVTTDIELVDLLDGREPAGLAGFAAELEAAGRRIGFPLFLRTGHGSGKHDWPHSCYVPAAGELLPHVAFLVDWSHSVDLFGLPTDVWALRELIPTTPLFVAFGGMPITREFRLFVESGGVSHLQPYWPADAIWGADRADWRERLAEASRLEAAERTELEALALKAAAAQAGGDWSVDLLEDSDGRWWLTDMALAERSFRY